MPQIIHDFIQPWPISILGTLGCGYTHPSSSASVGCIPYSSQVPRPTQCIYVLRAGCLASAVARRTSSSPTSQP
ncbi:uncharacterized protein FPRO_04671 [Fusarium proliferatum ET1]|uniref:Uncharacterized protein n=1 Tax=Fusarium proliferatum (strain ET1) TaxID=1227346 RepID=A0A1L7VH99_FUSPR|nr:uncharacterized protein FPRO_04671 [Fusarium proliferatum ET1]CZR39774.1 uncharacterized protein FPRO_04671 [Fusarium proliferatum ET1]